MSKLKVTFDSDADALAFANKWKLSDVPVSNSLDIDWHLAEDAVKDPTVITHTQLDTDEHEFIVESTLYNLEVLDDCTVEEDLGSGFFRVTSKSGLVLAKAVTSIDVSDTPIAFLGVSSMTGMDSADSAIDPTSSEGQWARIRVASHYRPLATSYAMHDTNYLSKPELYIMDTGVDSQHAEFQGADLEMSTFWCMPGVWVADDQMGHGTGVASMAVGANLGIADNVKLKIIKIQGKASDNVTLAPDAATVTATMTQLGEALDLLEQTIVADPLKTRILNVSWGVSRSAFLDRKFQALIDAGVTIIAAAGNNGIDVDLVTPAGISGCLTVGATDKYDIPAGYNNISPSDSGLATSPGLNLDLFAPGDEVMIAHPTGSASAYGISSGTSFAAPLVAGVAVVIGSMNESLVTANEMKNIVMSTSTKNALLFEDTTFSANQNNLAYIFTADPMASYKNADMVSYLGVSSEEPLVIDLNSNIDIATWKEMYPDDTPVYSLAFIDDVIKEEYEDYVSIDSETGIVTIELATGVELPNDTRLEMVEFRGIATTSRVTVTSNTIFYFHSNADHSDTSESDVTLALSDVNSISFFAYWARFLK